MCILQFIFDAIRVKFSLQYNVRDSETSLKMMELYNCLSEVSPVARIARSNVSVAYYRKLIIFLFISFETQNIQSS